MISRRELLFATAFSLLPGRVCASSGLLSNGRQNSGSNASVSWSEFQSLMAALAEAEANAGIDQQTVVESGMLYLKRLDINSAEFKHAVENSYESGNRYWLWQRLIKGRNINGGILNINSEQLVQLHDHPGATGMLRIISGQVEVWQFDEMKTWKGKQRYVKGSGSKNAGVQESVELVRLTHRVLKPGDVALLTAEKGNIHALRALSQQCSMLDFFIPPYQRNQRSWYEPLVNNWFDKEKVACRKIPQDEFSMAYL